jgi:hypothetical protein
MAKKYRGQVEFILVYVREAHPTDGRQVLPENQRDGALLPTAKSEGEKEEHATICVRTLNIKFTTVVDDMNQQVELDYAGWPDRLYLVGKDGRIAWQSDVGPLVFKPPDLEAAIKRELVRRAG